MNRLAKNKRKHFKNYRIIKKIILGCFMLLVSFQVEGQVKEVLLLEKEEITLEEIMQLARKKSLDVFKAKHLYGVNYWAYRSFKSSLLPKVDFNFDPFTYNRSFVKRYDSENNIDTYRAQQNLNTFANISVNQKIKATGATVYLNSDFNRLINYGDTKIENYSATPIRIGLIQPLMAFNTFKWKDKTAPLKFNKAKQDFIYELQTINLKSVSLFFNWALVNKKVDIANEGKKSAQKLFKIGKKRYALGAIEKDDLLNLELDVYNANTNLTKTQKELEKATLDLKLFLRDDSFQNTKPILPELISNLKIDTEKAAKLANANNPEVLSLKLKKIEALRDLDKAIKDNRFDLSLKASYGLNQQANTLQDAYGNFLDQQMVSVQFSIPLLDWGERKGNIKTAKSKAEVQDIEIQQQGDKFKQEISLKVIDFNLQEQLVIGAQSASEISRKSYQLTEKRFLSGRVDLLKLTSARKAWQGASENYIKSLSNYWRFYYEIQKLTLFDFIKGKSISQDFEKLMN